MTDEDLRRLFEGAMADMRRHFDLTGERLETRIDLVAEGVVRLDQRLDRTATEHRDEMRRGFADTQAMIKFSHAELDRRVRAVEESVADLQGRIERLESSKH
jgi:uncharacterized protein YceH (UPF0502 family)